VLVDVLAIIDVEPAAPRRREQSAAARGAVGAPAERGVAVPDIADGDGADGVRVGALQGEDDVDVLLAASADAEERDADAFVGPAGLGIRLGIEGHRGGGGSDAGCRRRLEEGTTFHVVAPGFCCTSSAPSNRRQRASTKLCLALFWLKVAELTKGFLE